MTPGFSIDLPAPSPHPRHAVVADPDPVLRAALVDALLRCRFTVAAAADPMAALALLSETETALALFRRGADGTGMGDGGERAAALTVALSPHTRVVLTVPGQDGPGAAERVAEGMDDGPFPILVLTADPVVLAARLCEPGLIPRPARRSPHRPAPPTAPGRRGPG